MIKVLSVILVVTFLLLGFLLLGGYSVENAGYVLITNAHWKIEMTIVSAIFVVFLSWFIIWLLLKVTFTFFAMGQFSFKWFSEYGNRNKQKLFDEALLAWFSHDLDKAKKSLSKLDGTQFDGLELLFLADVAAKQKDTQLQNEILLKACKLSKTKETATLLLAENHIEAGEASSGLALISESRDSAALQLKIKAMATAGQWRELSDTLDKWKKQLPKELYNQWKEQAITGVMSEIASKEGAKQLIAHWEKQSGKVRKDPVSQASFISQLLAQGMHNEAESYLVKFQAKVPEPILLPLFRKLKLKQPVESQKKLEAWLKQDDQNAELLSVLGELAFNSNDHILAEKVLQKAIKLNAKKSDIYLMAQVKEATQDNFQAMQLYKQLV